MSWLSDALGTSSINMDFNYTPQQQEAFNYNTVGYDPTTGSYNTSGTSADFINQFRNQSKFGFDKAQQLFDPNSQWYKTQGMNLRENIAGNVADTSRTMGQTLAVRGVGGGGLASLVNASNTRGIGEQVRKGMVDYSNLGLSAGTSLLGVAGQAAGAGGGLAGAESGRGLQQSLANQAAANQASEFGSNWQNMAAQNFANQQYGASGFNAAAYNQAREYGLTSQYNQAAGNRAARGNFMNSVLTGFGAMNPFGWGVPTPPGP